MSTQTTQKEIKMLDEIKDMLDKTSLSNVQIAELLVKEYPSVFDNSIDNVRFVTRIRAGLITRIVSRNKQRFEVLHRVLHRISQAEI